MNSETVSLVSEAITHAGEDPQLVQRLKCLENRRITPLRELPSMEFLFQFFGRPCFPRGELVAITGKPKSGKTFVSSMLMSLCFRQEVLTLKRGSPNPLRILWYDTEQSDESTQDILVHRILPMIDIGDGDDAFPEESFPIFNVRQDMWQERLPMLEVAIRKYLPDLVIVDGIRDLVNDINDGVLAQSTIERLMLLASEQHCCIACILHQNKSAEDKNLRGWIGTELTHKAFEVYECEKGENCIFSFSQILTRKYDIADTLKYIVDSDGIPQLASIEQVIENDRKQRQQPYPSRPEFNNSYITKWADNKPIFSIPEVFRDAMPEEGKRYTARDVQDSVMKLTNIVSPYFYNTLREQALKANIIFRTTDEQGYVVYYRPSPPGDAPF